MATSFRPRTLAEEHQPIQIWHQRLCHLNYTAVCRLATSDTISGIRLQQDSSTSNLFCEGCCKGKQHRTPFPMNIPCTRAFQPGALLHADLFGPIDPPSIGRALYYLLIKDDTTGYRLAFCIPKKSDVFSCIQQIVRQVLRDTGYVVKVIRSDRGGELVNKDAAKFYEENLIRQELTAPYNPEQNGAAERENRTVVELVRSMLHSQIVPSKF